MPHTHILDRGQAVLLIIDVQQRLLPHIEGGEAVVAATVRMIRAARALSVPILLSEQNPGRLGPTTPAIRAALPDSVQPLAKETFSCWGDGPIRSALQTAHVEQVIVAGIETHVCVLKTVLELLRVDYVPFVLVDAVGSRRAPDRDAALVRMRDAGAVLTTSETAVFELLTAYTDPEFKAVLDIVK